MYKIYLIVTIVGTALFIAFYVPANREREARELAKQEAVQARIAEEEAKRRADEESARAEDRRRREEREREEAEKEANEDRLAKERIASLKTQTEELVAETDRLKAELAASEAGLVALRDSRIALQKQVFDAKKANELARIQLRTAQLEAQRSVDLIATRTGANPAILLPPPVAPAAQQR